MFKKVKLDKCSSFSGKLEDQEKSSKKSGDQNPFSFKKFLETSSSSNQGRNNTRFSPNTPDFATDLPDFVQDHYGEPSIERIRTNSHEKPLPDFTLTSDSQTQRTARHAQQNPTDFNLPDFTTQNSTAEASLPGFQQRGNKSKGSNCGSDEVELPEFALPSSNNVKQISICRSNNSTPDAEVSDAASESDNFDFSLPSNAVPSSDSAKTKTSLPDFLADGIHKNSENFSDSDFLSPNTDDDLGNGFLGNNGSHGNARLLEENRRVS